MQCVSSLLLLSWPYEKRLLHRLTETGHLPMESDVKVWWCHGLRDVRPSSLVLHEWVQAPEADGGGRSRAETGTVWDLLMKWKVCACVVGNRGSWRTGGKLGQKTSGWRFTGAIHRSMNLLRKHSLQDWPLLGSWWGAKVHRHPFPLSLNTHTHKLRKLRKREKNHVCWAYTADGDCLLGQLLHTKLNAATNFQTNQNKSENKTILTAEKCGNVLRGNYSPFPLFHPHFSCHWCTCWITAVAPCQEACACWRNCAGCAGPGMLPACLAAWGPMSSDKDISPMPDASVLRGACIPAQLGAAMQLVLHCTIWCFLTANLSLLAPDCILALARESTALESDSSLNSSQTTS